jgi:hypothetical protein
VTGLSVSSPALATGATGSFTVSGTNPCGAAHIIYGDGTAITYPITGLPTTQSHIYQKPGTYTVVARGMGNCDGEATATVTVTGPPLTPAEPPAEVTGVTMAPNPANVREPVTIEVKGKGTCAYEVQYGDGNIQEANGRLPQTFRHTYAAPQVYTVIIRPTAPCTGRFTGRLRVVDPTAAMPRVMRVLVSPAPATAGQPVAITVDGTGRCPYTIDFGDGNSESRQQELPDRVQHAYPAGTYEVAVSASRPCSGSAGARLEVRGSTTAGITGIEAAPNPAIQGTASTLVIRGAGNCTAIVDWGDGNSQTISGDFPMRVTHVYPTDGRYVIRADAVRPCSGALRTELVVVPRR